MNCRILRKDFKRKKSMNVILLLFILLATMFIASSVSNLRIVMGGTTYFFDRAQMKDFFMFTMRQDMDAEDSNERELEDFLDNQKEVKAYTADDSLYIAKTNIHLDKTEDVVLNNSAMLNCYDISQQRFFDDQNREITDMKEGTIYLSYRFMQNNKLNKGDRITFTTNNGYKKEFQIAGMCKDAFLGSDMMGMDRYIISRTDMEDMIQKSGLPYGKLYSVETGSQEGFVKDFNNQNFTVVFSCEQSLVKFSYVMDMVIVAVLLLVSVCLILVSVVMLRFIIVFTLNEDYKEIGIMKAVGIPDRAIRRLYVTKYFVLSCAGALLGFLGALPFGQMLVKQVTDTIVVPDGNSDILLQLLVSVLLAAVITGFAYLSTGKIKKMTPMDAIRSGNTGKRYNRKSAVHLSGWRGRISSFLALNDVCCEWRKYLALFFMGIVGVWLLVMPLNTINTLGSEKIVKVFSVLDCDFFVVDDAVSSELILKGDKQAIWDYLDEVKNEIEEKGIDVDRVFMEMMFRLRIRKGDSSFRSLAIQGINTDASEYAYEQGEAPAYPNEVALAYSTAENIDAHIGDTVYIMTGNEEKEFVVSGLYQSMNNMGEGIRFHQDMELDYGMASGSFDAQVSLKGDVGEEELQKDIRIVKKLYPDAEVETVKKFISSMLGNIMDKLESMKVVILTIVVIINVLVVMLMQKMFLIRERGEIGMLKAVGFKTPTIIRWQTKRIAFVLFLGMIVGTLTGTPFSRLTSGQVFKMMGARNIEFVVNAWEVYGLYPVAVFICSVAACIITMRRVKKVSVQEINNIE